MEMSQGHPGEVRCNLGGEHRRCVRGWNRIGQGGSGTLAELPGRPRGSPVILVVCFPDEVVIRKSSFLKRKLPNPSRGPLKLSGDGRELVRGAPAEFGNVRIENCHPHEEENSRKWTRKLKGLR